MKVLRVLRMLDDLAEVFVFDVLLATPARRRLCALAAGVITLAAYASSGFWMAPAPRPEQDLAFLAAAPAGLPPLPDSDTGVAAVVVRQGQAWPHDFPALRAALDRHERELEALERVCAGGAQAVSRLVDFTGTARASDLGMLLAARAIVLRQRDCHFGAVSDLIALLRVSAALTRPHVGTRSLAPHVLGSMLENVAVRQLCEELRVRDLTRAEQAEIARALSERTPLTYGAAVQFESELARNVSWLSSFVETNQIPESHRGLRFYLPVVKSSRRAVASAVIERLIVATRAEEQLIVAGVPLPPQPPVRIQELGGWAFHLTPGAGWRERLATLWSNDRCVDLVARLIHLWRPGYLAEYAATCQARETEATALRDRCLWVLRASTPDPSRLHLGYPYAF